MESNSYQEAEVHHIKPVNGQRNHFGCEHHQENLQVVCHDCHVQITIEQRAAGLIGKRRTVADVVVAANHEAVVIGVQMSLDL